MEKRYIAGMGWYNFKPKYDWNRVEAELMYKNAQFPFNVDKILYTDCADFMKTLPPECIDLIIADPPFGIDFSGKENMYNRKRENVIDGYHEVECDAYREFSKKWISEIPRILKNNGSGYIISGWTHIEDILYAVRMANLNVLNHIIWKYNFPVFTKNKYATTHYHIIFFSKTKDYFFNPYEYYTQDVWEIKREYAQGREKNGNKLPTELVKKMIDFSSKPADLVFDPFMGNGTTAIVAKGTYRHYLGTEINVNMKKIHDAEIGKIEIGALYKRHSEMMMKKEDILKKYPHLKKYIGKKGTLHSFLKQNDDREGTEG